MRLSGALLVVVLALFLVKPAVAGVPAWCDEARALLDGAPSEGPEAWPRYLAIAEKMPREADAVLDDARARAGQSGTLAETLLALKAALADGCQEPVVVERAGAAADEVRAIVASDERFMGAREERDLLDEWKARLAAWLEEAFESELMRRYAGASRAVYLTALAFFVLFVAVRLWRARVKGRAKREEAIAEALIERERRRAFEEWQADARARLDEGDLRGALRAGQLALLARIGEVEEGAVTPARTNREVLRRLDEGKRSVVEPPLRAFEVSFYGGASLERSAVGGFLDDVQRAASALGGAR